MTNDGENTVPDKRIEDLEKRIKELGEKSSQTLLFLSFALVVVATLKDRSDPGQQGALRCAMYWWAWALFPVLVGILPLKELSLIYQLVCRYPPSRHRTRSWYCFVRWFKVALLWAAIILIVFGACGFIRAIAQVFPH